MKRTINERIIARSGKRDLMSLRLRTGAVVAGAVLLGWSAISAVSFSSTPSAETVLAGQVLFEHEWLPNDPLAGGGDGLGPVFNAKSCAACHFQGGIGGAGLHNHNVLAFEALPGRSRPDVRGGVVHAAAIAPQFVEELEDVHAMFPIEKNGLIIDTGCGSRTQDLAPVILASVNPPALFGGALVDKISDRAIRNNRRMQSLKNVGREFHLDFSGSTGGVARELPDGRVGKFGWKAQFATLEEFVAQACAVEVGLSNGMRSQDLPHEHVPDADAKTDLNGEQFYALVSFVGALPRPKQVLPTDETSLARVQNGEALFTEIGCANCHTPNLGGAEGLYSDLLLHVVEPPSSGPTYGRAEPVTPLPDKHPKSNQWKTPPLWGVADTAPYFHDGGSKSLEDAILRHQGTARRVTERFTELNPPERGDLIAFLESLRAPASAPVSSAAELASRDESE